MDKGKEIVKTNGYKFVLDAVQFVGITDIMEIQTSDVHSQTWI
jgi:hypothetical protein